MGFRSDVERFCVSLPVDISDIRRAFIANTGCSSLSDVSNLRVLVTLKVLKPFCNTSVKLGRRARIHWRLCR